MDDNNDNKYKYLGIGVVALLFVVAFSNIPVYTGWEVNANFSHFIINDDWRAYVGDSASTIGIQSGSVGYKSAVFKIDDGVQSDYNDIDWPRYTGTTKLDFGISGPTHVIQDAADNWIDADDDIPFQTYEKLVGGVSYRYEHHIYEVDLMVFTIGEAIMAIPAVGGDLYLGTCDGLPSRAYSTTAPDGTVITIYADRDHSAEFMAFIDFEVTPWSIYVGQQIAVENSTDYWVVSDEFVGVMSASIIEATAGQVGSETPTLPGTAGPHQQTGYQVNMYSIEDDSLIQQTYSPTSDGDETALGGISGIPEGVRLQLSGVLEPGLIHTVVPATNWWTSATPVQYQVYYRLRVDVLTAAGYTLISGGQPTGTPNVTWVEPPPPVWDPLGWLANLLGDPLGRVFDLISLVIIGGLLVLTLKYYWSRQDDN